MITSAQIRAACALLGLSQSELATLADLGVATVQRVEKATQQIDGSAQTVAKLEKALKGRGVYFIDADEEFGIGVRLRSTGGSTKDSRFCETNPICKAMR